MLRGLNSPLEVFLGWRLLAWKCPKLLPKHTLPALHIPLLRKVASLLFLLPTCFDYNSATVSNADESTRLSAEKYGIIQLNGTELLQH